MVLRHYKVKPQYFEDKYGMPCEEKPQPAMLPTDDDNDDSPDDKKPENRKQRQNTHGRFFD